MRYLCKIYVLYLRSITHALLQSAQWVQDRPRGIELGLVRTSSHLTYTRSNKQITLPPNRYYTHGKPSIPCGVYIQIIHHAERHRSHTQHDQPYLCTDVLSSTTHNGNDGLRIHEHVKGFLGAFDRVHARSHRQHCTLCASPEMVTIVVST